MIRIYGSLLACLLATAIVDRASAVDDGQLFRNYEDVCMRVQRGTAEMRTMLCGLLDKDRAFIREMIRDQIKDVCTNIKKICASGPSNRYGEFSSQLSCSEFVGYTNCGVADRDRPRDPRGDIRIVIAFIDAFEKSGAKVPPTLKQAIRLYAEALEANRDLQTAINRVNEELREFYRDAEIGCRQTEEPEFVAACTARIDRQYMARNTQAVLGWNNATPAGGNSVVREVLESALARWGRPRPRSGPTVIR